MGCSLEDIEELEDARVVRDNLHRSHFAQQVVGVLQREVSELPLFGG